MWNFDDPVDGGLGMTTIDGDTGDRNTWNPKIPGPVQWADPYQSPPYVPPIVGPPTSCPGGGVPCGDLCCGGNGVEPIRYLGPPVPAPSVIGDVPAPPVISDPPGLIFTSNDPATPLPLGQPTTTAPAPTPVPASDGTIFGLSPVALGVIVIGGFFLLGGSGTKTK